MITSGLGSLELVQVFVPWFYGPAAMVLLWVAMALLTARFARWLLSFIPGIG